MTRRAESPLSGALGSKLYDELKLTDSFIFQLKAPHGRGRSMGQKNLRAAKYTGVGAHSTSESFSLAATLNLDLCSRRGKFYLLAITTEPGSIVADFLSVVRSTMSLLGPRGPLREPAEGDYTLVAYDASEVTGRYRLLSLQRDAHSYVLGNGGLKAAVAGMALDGRQLLLTEEPLKEVEKVSGPPEEAAKRAAMSRGAAAAAGGFGVEISRELLRGLTALTVVSDRGLRRPNNEDSGFAASLKVSSKGFTRVFRVIGVADGAGGHEYGELASSEGVLELLGVLLPGLAEGEEVSGLIREAFEAANKRVLSLIEEKGLPMASTLSLAVAEEDVVHVGHVGDSRIYMIGRRLTRLTTDHKPASGPRNVITNALGLPSMWVELRAGGSAVRVEPGAMLLAATDGLTEMVSEGEVLTIALRYSKAPLRLCSELIELAKKRGGYDNVTVSVMVPLRDL